jgi:hydrogenase maturation protease
MKPPKTLIVGIGSPHGDDVAGWKVAELLADELAGPDICIKQATSPLQILHWMEWRSELQQKSSEQGILANPTTILCDACRGFGEPGEINRWTWPDSELVNVSWSGTHDFSLTATLQLAERLNRLPPQVVIWTIEAGTAKAFDGMSPEVEAAVPRLAKSIASELLRHSSVKVEVCTNNHS